MSIPNDVSCSYEDPEVCVLRDLLLDLKRGNYSRLLSIMAMNLYA